MRPLIRACCLLLLLASGASAVETISDIAYDSPGSDSPELDLHFPSMGLLPGTPTILFLHGGAWISGDKTDDNVLHHILADAGYAVVSGNYTLATPEAAAYPQAVHDVKAIVRWIRTEGQAWNLSSTIIACGPSVGGYLSELLATTENVNVFEPLTPPPGGYRIHAGIPFWGLSDLEQQARDMGSSGPLAWFLGAHYNEQTAPLYLEASPLTWVDSSDPPQHLVHGLLDPYHPWQQTQFLHDALTNAGVPGTVEYFDAGHGYDEYGSHAIAAAMMLQRIPDLLALGRTADLDGNGIVNNDDLLWMLDAWSDCPSLPVDCPADLDGNGEVDVDDLLEVLQMYGNPGA
ncbi:MAG: alpha/beta hydrolase fold domain-containing protein [Planctomycetota bacterium]|nr:alpha/beta hydrolase fold domain-containing protein [Planctomycetota bacterium]